MTLCSLLYAGIPPDSRPIMRYMKEWERLATCRKTRSRLTPGCTMQKWQMIWTIKEKHYNVFTWLTNPKKVYSQLWDSLDSLYARFQEQVGCKKNFTLLSVYCLYSQLFLRDAKTHNNVAGKHQMRKCM